MMVRVDSIIANYEEVRERLEEMEMRKEGKGRRLGFFSKVWREVERVGKQVGEVTEKAVKQTGYFVEDTVKDTFDAVESVGKAAENAVKGDFDDVDDHLKDAVDKVEKVVIGNPSALVVEGVLTPIATETGLIDKEHKEIVEYFHNHGLD